MKKGFTLIELMVVIAIIGVLAVILLPQIASMANRARVARTVGELNTIVNAMNMYLVDVGSYPPSVQDLGRNWGADVGLVERGMVTTNHLANWKGPYLKEWPIKTAWGGIIGCSAVGAYYSHAPIGWIDRDGIAGNDPWVHMNPACVRYDPQMAIEIDRVIDDGVASSGNMRVITGPEYIYLYVGEGTRSW